MEEPSQVSAGPDASSDEGTLDQATIDALLGGASDDVPASDDAPASAADSLAGDTSADVGTQPVSQDDIDALLDSVSATGNAGRDAESPSSSGTTAEDQHDTRVDSIGRPLDEVTDAMQGALDQERAATNAHAPALDDHIGIGAGGPAASPSSAAVPPTEPFDLPDLKEAAHPKADPKRLSMLNDVRLRVKIELGRTQMLVEDVLKLGEGGVVELDKLAGDPVDVWVNERLIARGEVLVLNDNFCVRISEVFSNDPHRVST